LENNGTLTSTQKLNVYVCGDDSDDTGHPDFNTVYAEGQLDCSTITSAAWYTITFDYWDYAKALQTAAMGSKYYIAIKPEGDTSSLYAKWNYDVQTGGVAYRDTTYCMVNSDSDTPSSQSTADYCFKLYAARMYTVTILVTDAYQADEDLTSWGNVYVNLDETGGRNSKLTYIGYELRPNNSGWTGTYTETTNTGAIIGTNRWIKLKMTFARPTGWTLHKMDSFTLRSLRVTYNTQTLADTLSSSCTDEGRYWYTCKIKFPFQTVS